MYNIIEFRGIWRSHNFWLMFSRLCHFVSNIKINDLIINGWIRKIEKKEKKRKHSQTHKYKYKDITNAMWLQHCTVNRHALHGCCVDFIRITRNQLQILRTIIMTKKHTHTYIEKSNLVSNNNNCRNAKVIFFKDRCYCLILCFNISVCWKAKVLKRSKCQQNK